MDWTYPTTESGRRSLGISEIATRLIDEIDDVRLAGTRFTYDAREMLRATREIEETLLGGGHLWVGFQNAGKLQGETDRYARITASGAEVIAFGTGTPSLPESVHLRWIGLEPTTDRVENQWFLVTSDPEPIAFVSWEISEPDRFGQGGIDDEDKRFVGFVTDDRRVIDALVTHLDTVASTGAPR